MIWQNSHLRFTDALTFMIALPFRGIDRCLRFSQLPPRFPHTAKDA